MKNLKDTGFLVTAALLAALTYVATTILKFPTPTFGYVHIGDGFVILSGLLLGPAAGGLAAGIGSMFSDLLGGYATWAPGTFVIKFLTAATAAVLYKFLDKRAGKKHRSAVVAVSGIAGELVMTFGYFLYNIFMLTIVSAGGEKVALYSAITQSLAEIPFNLMQGLAGILVASALYPALRKIPAVRAISLKTMP